LTKLEKKFIFRVLKNSVLCLKNGLPEGMRKL